jgi:hypothetical protein
VNQWIWHIESSRGGGFGASNNGDVVTMTIVFFPFNGDGNGRKLWLTKCK